MTRGLARTHCLGAHSYHLPSLIPAFDTVILISRSMELYDIKENVREVHYMSYLFFLAYVDQELDCRVHKGNCTTALTRVQITDPGLRTLLSVI